jgi:rod shape-determining protein MreB
MARFRRSIAIDLGTDSVLVYVNNKGIVLNEASVIAKDILSEKIMAVGDEAKKILGRTPGNVHAVRPIKMGIISDLKATEEMLKYFLSKSVNKALLKPDVLICVPSKSTQVEKRAVLQAAEAAGFHRAYLIEEALAAALGADVDIKDAGGNMVLDVGGGTSDLAVVSMGQVVSSNSIDVAGDMFDKQIMDYVRKKYGLLIGENSAEELKITASKLKFTDSVEVRGRQIEDGLPTKIILPVEEVYKAILPMIDQLVDGVKYMLEATPPELSSDLYQRGIILTGGAAQTLGLASRIEEKLQIPAKIAENPGECAIQGTAKALTWIDSLDEEKTEAMRAKQKQLERNERLRRR